MSIGEWIWIKGARSKFNAARVVGAVKKQGHKVQLGLGRDKRGDMNSMNVAYTVKGVVNKEIILGSPRHFSVNNLLCSITS